MRSKYLNQLNWQYLKQFKFRTDFHQNPLDGELSIAVKISTAAQILL